MRARDYAWVVGIVVVVLVTGLRGPVLPSTPEGSTAERSAPSGPLSGNSLVYSTYFGGNRNDWINDIAVELSGNAYIAGVTDSSDFPVTPGAFNITANTTSGVAFVAALNTTGGGLLYSTYFPAGVTGIAVDSAGYAYVTGRTYASIPTTPGAFNTMGPGAFVAKLNPTGTALVYSTFIGQGTPLAIAIDSAGNAYIVGETDSSGFPTTAGAFDTTYNGGCFFGIGPEHCSDAFVTKVNPTGTGLVYSTFLGGNASDDRAFGIAVDPGGNAFVTGLTRSPNFPVTPGAFDTSCGSDGFCDAGRAGPLTDGFVAKLTPDGSALAYATFLGGNSEDSAIAVAVDGSGDAYVTGATSSPDFPFTAGAFDVTEAGDKAFVTKLNPAGSALAYSTFLGGDPANGGGYYRYDRGFSITVDSAGSATVAGDTVETDFPVTPGAFDASYNDGLCGIGPDPCLDAFVTKLNPAGSGLAYSSYLGGAKDDSGLTIAQDPTGGIYVAGRTTSRDFPVTPGAFGVTNPGTNRFNEVQGFVSKFGLPGGSRFYDVTVGTSPGGLQVEVDGVRGTAPATWSCEGGSTHTISAPSPQTLGAASYAFVSWSDGGAQTHTITCSAPATITSTFSLFNAPDFILTASPAQRSVFTGSSTSYTVTATALNGYTGPYVTMSLQNPPSGISGGCAPAMVLPTGSCTLTVTIGASAPVGAYTLAISGTNGTATRLATVNLQVAQASSFRLMVSPTSMGIPAGGSRTASVTITAEGDFSGSVSLSAAGVPGGVLASFSPPTVPTPGNSTLTLAVDRTTPPGAYTITIRGNGGGLERTTALLLQVGGPAPEAGPWILGVALLLSVIAVILFAWAGFRRKREPPEVPDPVKRNGEV